MMSFFKKNNKPQPEVDDLDIGYENEYYSGYSRDNDRRDTDRRDPEPRVQNEPAGDRWGEPRPQPAGDRWEEPTPMRSDDYFAPAPGGWQEPPAAGYRPFNEEKTEPVPTPAPAPEYLYFTPSSYRDCREGIVKGLAAGHVVVVRVDNLETTDVLRLFDYMMGAVLALDGEMVRPRSSTVVLLPHDVELDEDALDLEDEEYDEDDYDEDEAYDEDDDEYEDDEYDDEEYDDEEEGSDEDAE